MTPDDALLRLICKAETGKCWKNATEDDRERCRQIADDLDRALNASFGLGTHCGATPSANLTELLHSLPHDQFRAS